MEEVISTQIFLSITFRHLSWKALPHVGSPRQQCAHDETKPHKTCIYLVLNPLKVTGELEIESLAKLNSWGRTCQGGGGTGIIRLVTAIRVLQNGRKLNGIACQWSWMEAPLLNCNSVKLAYLEIFVSHRYGLQVYYSSENEPFFTSNP